MGILSLFFIIPYLCAVVVQGAVLRNFQVGQPPIVPHDAKQCTVKVLQRDFAFSYGSSEVVQLTPPTDCGTPGSWAAVTLNLTVTSNGTQYDRLAHFTFQNVEIWRTSTPEPTRGDGIIWTYIKDVSQYIPLFAKPGTFILQLDNIIQKGLDGVYSTVVYATYYASSAKNPPAKKADLILPISTGLNNTGNEASVPPSFSRNLTLPQNTVAVYAEIIPSGNGEEEFWYANIANQYLSTLPDGTTYGQGPFREVRLLIDGQVAGVAFPYPVVFTGGFAPPLWRPISAYGALDLPTYFIDVTPFVPLLADGQSHNFTIDVVSAEADHQINPNWYVSGSLQVITDSSSKPTTGKITQYNASPFALTSNTGNVQNGEVDVTVTATRKIHIESDIISGSGKRTHAIWTQDLTYSNVQTYKNNASIQTIRQTAKGIMAGTQNGIPTVADTFSYPFNVDFEFLSPEWRNWTTLIDHSYNRIVLPSPLRLGTTTNNHQVADAFFQLQTGGNYGNGTSNNTFNYLDLKGNTYTRKVNAAYNVITLDEQGGSLPAQPDGLNTGGGNSRASGVEISLSLFGGTRHPGVGHGILV